MHPILVDWGWLVLPAWHTFFVLGALTTYFVLMRTCRRFHPEIAESRLAALFSICYASGYFGARLLSIFIEEPDTAGLTGTIKALFQFGAMTFYGGAIAAFVVGALYCRVKRLNLATMIDAGLPAGLAGLAVGRIGCFLNGDDYGIPVPLTGGEAPPFWAVTFPNLQDGVARYPVQLYEAIAVAILVGVLLLNYGRLRRIFRPGAVGLFAAVGYANLRFTLEFLRGDFRGSIAGTWLSTSQFISILVLATAGISIPFWVRRRRSVQT